MTMRRGVLLLAIALSMASCRQSPKKALKAIASRGIAFAPSSLIQSAFDGDAETVGLFLRAGMDPNVVSEIGSIPGKITPLAAASAGCHADVVRALLAKGANANAKTQGGDTTLTLAARACAEKPEAEARGVIELLLDAGADLKARGRGYDSTLAIAIAAGNVPFVKIFMERKGIVDGHEQGALMDEPPATISAFNDRRREVRRLLLAYLAAQAKGATSLTPAEARKRIAGLGLRVERDGFHAAVHAGNVEALQLFFATGLDPIALGWLRDAAWSGKIHRNSVEFLAARGSAAATLVLPAAVEHGDLALVRKVLAHGADARAQGLKDQFPLAVAASKNWAEAVVLLLAAGADPNPPISPSPLALACAASGGRDDDRAARALIQRGADVDRRDSSGLTPAVHAARALGVANLRALIESGANLGIRGYQHENVLREALNRRDDAAAQTATLELLLRTAGAWPPTVKLEQIRHDLGSASMGGYRFDEPTMRARMHVGSPDEMTVNQLTWRLGLASTLLSEIEVAVSGRRVGVMRFDLPNGWHFEASP